MTQDPELIPPPRRPGAFNINKGFSRDFSSNIGAPTLKQKQEWQATQSGRSQEAGDSREIKTPRNTKQRTATPKGTSRAPREIAGAV